MGFVNWIAFELTMKHEQELNLKGWDKVYFGQKKHSMIMGTVAKKFEATEGKVSHSLSWGNKNANLHQSSKLKNISKM